VLGAYLHSSTSNKGALVNHIYYTRHLQKLLQTTCKINFCPKCQNPYSNSYRHLSVGRMDPTEKHNFHIDRGKPTGIFWFPVVASTTTHPCKSPDIGMALRLPAVSLAPRRCCGHRCEEAAGHMARWRCWRTRWAGPLEGYCWCRPVKPRTNMNKHFA